MADISKEIADFKSAVHGEEVRGSMISLAEKLNTEVEENTTNVNQAVETANAASTAANQAVQDAAATLQAANQAVTSAAGSASAAAGSASAAAGSAEYAAGSATSAAGSASAAAQSAADAAEAAAGLGGFNGSASSVTAIDIQGLLGGPGASSNVQALIDYIADQVKNQLITDSALTAKLANYILKSQIVNNLLATQAGNVLDAVQGKALDDKITQLNSEIENIGVGEWTFAGSATGTSQTINFPNTYNELAVYATYSSGSFANVFTWHVVRPLIDNFSVYISLRNGYGYNGNNLVTVEIHKDTRTIKLINFFYDSQNVSASCSVFAYYR